MNFKTHKDKPPQETINLIKAILTDLGIFTIEKRWHSVTDGCYSVSLGASDIRCFSNGKGISEEYALASAYAEFIERLQADFLLSKEFGLMGNDDFKYPHDIEMTLGAYAGDNENIIKKTMDPIVAKKYKDFMIKCFPAYEVIEGKVKYLPYFIKSAVMSNGVCAGNTPEEAICQGICEIFERFVIREIYYNKNIDLPTIPLSALKDLDIYRIIDKLIKKGYWLIIKDCSLNGNFPVVGVILMNKNKNSYLYRFGSDQIFEVALQRCLTELFQGIDDFSLIKEFVNKFDFSCDQFANNIFPSEDDNKKYIFQKSVNLGNEILPNNIFTSAKETLNFKKGFQVEFKNHSDSLRFLTDIVKKNNYRMYIQNLSTLGFNTYRIYMPELSTVKKIYDDKFKAFFIEINFIKNILLRLKQSSTDDIEKCANLLEPIIFHPDDYYSFKHRLSTSDSILNIIIDDNSHIKQFDNFIYLLGMLFFRTGNYEKAFKYLNLYIKEHGKELGNLDYYSCVLLYLKLKSDKIPDNEIGKILKNIFGDNLSKEVVGDLASPEDCFRYFTLPECGDCLTCPIRKECRYDKWKEINGKIVRKIKSIPINQEDIAGIFKKQAND